MIINFLDGKNMVAGVYGVIGAPISQMYRLMGIDLSGIGVEQDGVCLSG